MRWTHVDPAMPKQSETVSFGAWYQAAPTAKRRDNGSAARRPDEFRLHFPGALGLVFNRTDLVAMLLRGRLQGYDGIDARGSPERERGGERC